MRKILRFSNVLSHAKTVLNGRQFLFEVNHFDVKTIFQGVKKLKEELISTALNQPYMGESIPEVWLNLEREVMTRRKNDSVISYETLEEMALHAGIFEKDEVLIRKVISLVRRI